MQVLSFSPEMAIAWLEGRKITTFRQGTRKYYEGQVLQVWCNAQGIKSPYRMPIGFTQVTNVQSVQILPDAISFDTSEWITRPDFLRFVGKDDGFPGWNSLVSYLRKGKQYADPSVPWVGKCINLPKEIVYLSDSHCPIEVSVSWRFLDAYKKLRQLLQDNQSE